MSSELGLRRTNEYMTDLTMPRWKDTEFWRRAECDGPLSGTTTESAVAATKSDATRARAVFLAHTRTVHTLARHQRVLE